MSMARPWRHTTSMPAPEMALLSIAESSVGTYSMPTMSQTISPNVASSRGQ